MLPTLPANTAAHICAIGAVFEVVPSSRHNGSIERGQPFLVGLGEPPHLVGGQTEFAERCSERLAAVEGIKQPLAHLDRESLLRLAPEAYPRRVALRFPAMIAVSHPPATG